MILRQQEGDITQSPLHHNAAGALPSVETHLHRGQRNPALGEVLVDLLQLPGAIVGHAHSLHQPLAAQQAPHQLHACVVCMATSCHLTCSWLYVQQHTLAAFVTLLCDAAAAAEEYGVWRRSIFAEQQLRPIASRSLWVWTGRVICNARATSSARRGQAQQWNPCAAVTACLRHSTPAMSMDTHTEGP